MLLELPSLSQVPAAHCVVQTSRPQFGAIVGDVDTTGSICVALELPMDENTRPSHLKFFILKHIEEQSKVQSV